MQHVRLGDAILLIAELDGRVNQLILSGHRLSTTKVYNSIQLGFFRFCDMYQLAQLPLTELLMLRFIAFKAPTVGYSSFKVYLAALQALQALHMCNYLPPPLENTAHIKLALKSVELQASAPNNKSPITVNQLCNIMVVLPCDLDTVAVWSVITFAFFGCFRAGELVVTPGHDHITMPRVTDVSFGYCNNLVCMQLIVKCSKMNPHWFTTTIGFSGHIL
jgi:hypothetical protein